MRDKFDKEKPFNDYIRSVQAEESARIWKKIIVYSVLFLLVCGGGIITWRYLNTQNSSLTYDVYLLDELSEETLLEKLEAFPEGIVVFDSNINLLDTINDMQDYKEFVSISEQIRMTMFTPSMADSSIAMETEYDDSVYDDSVFVFIDDMPEEALEEETVLSSEEDNRRDSQTKRREVRESRPSPPPLKTYSVDIAGELMAGNRLTFSIDRFDADKLYIIDFGNGDRRRMRSTRTYIYSEPGMYNVVLTAIDTKTDQQREFKKQIRIAPDSRRQEVASSLQKETTNAPRPGISASPATTSSQTDPGTTSEQMRLSEDTNTRMMDKSAGNSADILATKGNGEADEATPPLASFSAPLSYAEKMPEYNGGIAAMSQFLTSKLEYPVAARDNEIEGTVYIQMVVSPRGKLSNFEVAKGIGYGCDEEALRIAKLMPDWKPGEQSGQRVPVVYTIPIVFNIK